MGGSHPYADGEGSYLGLRPPPNQVKGTPKPWKGIPACSQHWEQPTPLGQASSPAPWGVPVPRASPHATGARARGYAASQGQALRQQEALALAQQGTDVQVAFTLITVLAAYPLPVQPPDAVPPRQPKKPPLRWSLSNSQAAAHRRGSNLRHHLAPSSGAEGVTKTLQVHYSRTGGCRHHWKLGYCVVTDGDRGGKLTQLVLKGRRG